MTPAATSSRSHRAVVDQGKETPFVSLFSPFLERIIDEKRSHHKTKSVEKPSNLLFEKGSQKPSNPRGDASVVQSGFVRPTLIRDGNRQGEDKRLTSVMESKRKSEKVHVNKKSFFSKYQIRINPLFESEPSKGLKNIGLKKGHSNLVVGTHRSSPCIAPARGDASVVVQSGFVRPTLIWDGNRQGEDKRLTSVMESKRKSQKVDLTKKPDKNVVNIHRMIPHVVSASLSEFVQPTSILKGGKPIESQKHKGHEKRLSSVVERRRKSEHIGLVRKQDKQVVRIQRTGVVPAQGHIPVVGSGFERPTLIQKDSKSTGSEKLQGQEKRLSAVVEYKRKSKHIGLVRKQDKQVVRTQRTITGVVPAQGHIPVVRSEFEQPTLIQKDSKSIGSEKLQGQEKRFSSVVESRRKSEHVGLVRKHDKQVVRTQRTITGVVPGHIPVVRSGFERPTLIQKDSKSIGSEKLQGSEKLLSSIVESKKKSGNIDSSRKNDIKVVGTRKDLVDERPLQSVSKQNVKAVPQLPPYKGRKINSTSELKARWKF